MILSVPHTGTRTLVELLGGDSEVKFFHFGQHESRFEALNEAIDVPLRDPLATSLSWRANGINRLQGRNGNNPMYDEFRRWDLAIDYLSRKDWTPHIMEDHPVLKGQSKPTLANEYCWYKQSYAEKDLKKLMELPETQQLLKWYPTTKHFFEPFYGRFWWE